MPITELSLAVVGVRFPNSDGSNRRFLVMLCEPGDPIELRLEPKNPHDPRAVAVLTERGGQLGYISAERAPFLGSVIRSGAPIRAAFQEATEHGAIIRVTFDGNEPDLPPAFEQQTDIDPDWWPDEIPPDD
ncbi:HIRAN domain-containing protein [Sphingomonas sp. MMS24-J13]|uniref:HIRAN domain-containing protein n=1 Tax=Sphingomonas sp. MMS24-J13 TaxID=3238686 RepID=UPI00384E594A